MHEESHGAAAPWARSDLPAGERARFLLAAATLEEKLHMVHGAPPPPGVRADGFVAAIPRLGVPELREVGSGAGLTGGPATALPAPIAQSATWDPELSRRCGLVIGLETRAQGANVAIGGDVNIARTPLNGRTFEAYGEDPLLAARMIVPHLRAIQEQGVIATVKHFALNNQETNRGSRYDYPPGAPGVDARASERTMRQIYLPAFEAAVTEAGVGVVMTAYNRVNGDWCSEHHTLLTAILKQAWGFTGWVVSDWVSVHSTAGAALAGLDQEMPWGRYFGEPLEKAIRDGQIDEAVLDDKVLRIWGTMFRFGLFDEPDHPVSHIGHPEHLRVAEDVATNSAVLLKNDGLLPLEPRALRLVAVIGADADADAQVVAGGGSSHVIPSESDTVLEALRAHLPGVDVEWAPGTDPVTRAVTLPGLDPVPSWVLRTGTDPGSQRGLLATHYPARDFRGAPLQTRVDHYVAEQWRPGRGTFNGDTSQHTSPPLGTHSVVWEGVFTAPAAGTYTFDLTSVDGSRLRWDGELLIDNGGTHPPRSVTATVELDAGSTHTIRVEYSPESTPVLARVKLGWAPPDGLVDEGERLAAEAAARADVAVVVARDVQSESSDQSSLRLPGGQDRLIHAVAAANPRTVVVLQSGGPVLMPWLGEAGAVLEAWYGGARAGTAVARLLTGQAVPSGKLPITFPRSQDDLPTSDPRQFPGVGHVADYREGLEVGYRHYDAHGIEPLFPFGHGLSYTAFEYRSLQVRVRRDAGGADAATGGRTVNGPTVNGLTVNFRVRNVGDRAGTETAQVYLRLPPDAQEPPQRLAGFARVHLLPGESRSVSVEVGPRELSVWDEAAHDWRIPPGSYEVGVGGSSRDRPLSKTVEVADV